MTEKDDRPWKIRRPKGMEKYILENCQVTNYMIFKTTENWWLCTGCGEKMEMNGWPLVHSKDRRVVVTCPHCGREAVPKDARYGRKGLMDHGRIAWTKAYKAVTFLEVDEFLIDYGPVPPAVRVFPTEQIRLSAKEQKRMDWREGWFTKGDWVEVKHVGLKRRPGIVYSWSSWHDHIWWEQIETGTDLRYSERSPIRFDEGYWDENRVIERWIRYMADFLKYPAIELLEKSGFEVLVMNRASGLRSSSINIRGKNLRSILRLNKGDIRKLRKIEPTIAFMEDLRGVRKLVPDADIEDIEEMGDIIGSWMSKGDWELIRATADVRRVILRLLEERRETGDRVTLKDYADYIGAMNKMGCRLDKRAIYPRNFIDAHDEATEAAAKLDDKGKFQGFAESQRRITGMEEPWAMGDYLIRPAASPAELRKESKALSHCVRTYIAKVARGETSILFVREVDRPDIPFFTLELSPMGTIVQCRGDHNKPYPEEVKTFLAEWKKWWDRKVKKRRAA